MSCNLVLDNSELTFWEGDAKKRFSVKKGVFSEKGGGNSVNQGSGKDFYRKGNSVKRFGPFIEPPDSETWKVAVLIPFPKISSQQLPRKSKRVNLVLHCCFLAGAWDNQYHEGPGWNCVEINLAILTGLLPGKMGRSWESKYLCRHWVNGVGRGRGQAVLNQISTRIRLKSG